MNAQVSQADAPGQEQTLASTIFGQVTTKRVIYNRSRGWFSGGSREDIPLAHVTSVRLDTSRHLLGGILLVLIGLPMATAVRNSDALQMIGVLLVARDYRKAVGWCRKAADQGNAKAEFALGAAYYLSIGVPRDYERAAKWWRLAAKQGDTTAEAALTRMHKSCLQSQHGKLYAASIQLVSDVRGISRMKGIFQAEIHHMLPTARRVYKETGIVPPAVYDVEASEQQAIAGMMVRERVDWHNYRRFGGTATSPAAVRAPRDPCAKWRE